MFYVARICNIHFWIDFCEYVFYRDENDLWKWARAKRIASASTCHRCNLAERAARENDEDWVRGSPSEEKLIEHIDKQLDDLCEEHNDMEGDGDEDEGEGEGEGEGEDEE